MSIGSASGLGSLIATYSRTAKLDMSAVMAKNIINNGQGSLWFGQSELEQIADRDGQQKWGAKWLDSYRTVLIQRTQALQKKLNNIYSQQLSRNLYKKIADNPNYNMANLPKMEATGNLSLAPKTSDHEQILGSDGAMFSMNDKLDHGQLLTRGQQMPQSYEFGKPARDMTSFEGIIGGGDWSNIDNIAQNGERGFLNIATGDDWAKEWSSRQYNFPEAPFGIPNPLDFIIVYTPMDMLNGKLPPLMALPLLPPFVWFDVFGLVGALLKPIFYPMFFYRFETFAHSESQGNTIDAQVLRSDYNFKTNGFGQFPLLGPLLGAVMGTVAMGVAATTGALQPGVSAADTAANAMDLMLNPQSAAMAPQKTENETGAFFATTQALQDWDMGSMEYEYFSAANYQQDFIDTDFLSIFRTAGVEAFKLIVSLILKATGVGEIFNTPPLSWIKDPIIGFISQMLIDKLLLPIRAGVEVDAPHRAQNAHLGAPQGTTLETTAHIGDMSGLFGIINPVTDGGGFAAGYGLPYDNAPGSWVFDFNNQTNINHTRIYTTKQSIGSLWDGRGLPGDVDVETKTFEGISERLTGRGYGGNPDLNLAEFRAKLGEGAIFANDEMTAYNRARDDYSLTAKTKFAADGSISFGSRVLNPSFGGLRRMTDLNTNLEDSFFDGSIALAPWHGLKVDGDDDIIGNNAGDPDGDLDINKHYNYENVLATAINGTYNGWSTANGGNVTFDGTSASPDAYTFDSLSTAGPGSGGLRVSYLGPNGLKTGTLTPQNIPELRDRLNYVVTDLGGERITAELLTDTQPTVITHNPSPAGPVTVAPIRNFGESSDTAVVDNDGTLDLGLSGRVEALTPYPVVIQKDNDATFGNNSTSLVLFETPADRAATTALLGVDATPAAGGDYQTVDGTVPTFNQNGGYNPPWDTNPGSYAGGLAGWTDWNFVPMKDPSLYTVAPNQGQYRDDLDQDGVINEGPRTKNGVTLWQSAEADYTGAKEAALKWNELVNAYVDPSYYRKELITDATDTYDNDNDGGTPEIKFSDDAWNVRLHPGVRVVGTNSDTKAKTYQYQDGSNEVEPTVPYYGDTNHPDYPLPPTYSPDPYNWISEGPTMGYNAGNPPPPTAVNPYFWKGNDGYEYITIWKGDKNSDGSPDLTAEIQSVLRFKQGDNEIQVVSDGSAMLQHRQSDMIVMPDDSYNPDTTANPSSKLEATLADLRAKGYTQGRDAMDTTGALYNTPGGVIAPMPPAGAIGDFTVKSKRNGEVVISFTKSYEGIITVPPNSASIWDDVNGWWIDSWSDRGAAGGFKQMIKSPTAGSEYIWADQRPGSVQPSTGYSEQLVDKVTFKKSFTIAGPAGTTGDVLPGEFIDLTVTGANLGEYKQNAIQFDAGMATDLDLFLENEIATFIPDRFSLTITNAKGTYTVPLVTKDSATNGYKAFHPDPLRDTGAPGDGGYDKDYPDQRGQGVYHIPSEFLAQGNNEITLDVNRGGMYYHYLKAEPPRANPPTVPTDVAAQNDFTQQHAAGFWVNTVPARDHDGGPLHNPGSLFYEDECIVDTDVTGEVFKTNADGYIVRETSTLGVDWDELVEINDGVLNGFRPDSFRSDLPEFGGTMPFPSRSNDGYQLKADQKHGIKIAADQEKRTINTYTLETVDRYSFDPVTQQIMDVFPADGTGPQGKVEKIEAPWANAGALTVNTQPPYTAKAAVMSKGADAAATGAGGISGVTSAAAQAPHLMAASGATGIAKIQVGQPIDPSGKQTFGSDDNKLTREIFKAMKIIDLDASDEDLDGDGVLDAGEDINNDGVLNVSNGNSPEDARAYREYRDAFNMGYLDHIYITGSAYAATGGGFSSAMEFRWTPQSANDSNRGDDYLQNYEYFRNDTDRQNRKYRTIRKADMLMNSFFAFRSEQT